MIEKNFFLAVIKHDYLFSVSRLSIILFERNEKIKEEHSFKVLDTINEDCFSFFTQLTRLFISLIRNFITFRNEIIKLRNSAFFLCVSTLSVSFEKIHVEFWISAKKNCFVIFFNSFELPSIPISNGMCSNVLFVLFRPRVSYKPIKLFAFLNCILYKSASDFIWC